MSYSNSFGVRGVLRNKVVGSTAKGGRKVQFDLETKRPGRGDEWYDTTVPFICFWEAAKSAEEIEDGEEVRVAGHLEGDEYQGRTYLRARVREVSAVGGKPVESEKTDDLPF